MLKKGINFSICMFGICVGLTLTGCGIAYILRYFGLMFRAWFVITQFIIMALLILFLMGGIIYTLAKVYSLPQQKKRIRRKVLAAAGIIVTLSSTAALGIIALFGLIFANPEHVVEKHNQKMVAYVNSFIDVYVTYHEYKNFLVCGYEVIGHEWYGSGGYDPFIRDPMPEPKTYKFYDTGS